MNITLEQARNLATVIIATLFEWPEDHWFTLSDNWDLNLWEADGERHAAIYPVVNGQTNTSEWHEVEVV